MAIKLTEKGFLEKTRKAEQEMAITPELDVNYGVGVASFTPDGVILEG